MARELTIKCNRCGEEYVYFPETVLEEPECCGVRDFTTIKDEDTVFEIETPYGKMVMDGRHTRYYDKEGNQLPIPDIPIDGNFDSMIPFIGLLLKGK